MQTAARRILVEFLWLTFSLTLTLGLAILLFGWASLKAQLSSWLPFALLFFIVTLAVRTVKTVNVNITS